MSTYRIDGTFETIGAFWISPHPSEPFTGTLVSRKGRVEIRTAPSYMSDLEAIRVWEASEALYSEHDLKRVFSICGFTPDNRCTLLNSLEVDGCGDPTNDPTRPQVISKRYVATRTVMGLHVESADAAVVDEAAFYFRKMRYLLPISWDRRIASENISYVVPMVPTEIFRFDSVEIGAQIVCEIRADGRAEVGKSTSIRSIPCIRVIPHGPQSVDWFAACAFRAENFFTLFLGTSLRLKRIQLFQGKDQGWIVQALNRRKEKIDLQACVRSPFKLIADAFAKWLTVPIDKQPVELIVLNVLKTNNLFVETEFLSLVQALEGFGRIHFAYGEEKSPSFGSLIEQTYDLLTPGFAIQLVGNRDAFKKKITQSRSYYTHLGSPRKDDATNDDKELFLFNQKLKAFLRCVMLVDLGIPEQFLKKPICYQATRRRFRVSYRAV